MDFPEFQMPIETAWAGGEGSVWIAYQLTLSDTTTWVLLDPDGSTRGRLDLPSSTRLLWHRGDTLFASVPDDLDVPWLVRYTLNDVD